MKEERILNVLGKVDEKYIKEADPEVKSKRRAPIWTKWVAMAATFVIFFSCLGFYHLLTPNGTDSKMQSLFVITAQALDGNSAELNPFCSVLSSLGNVKNIFGVDMPLYRFYVRPSDWHRTEEIWLYYDLEVLYNGEKLTQEDKAHISVGYITGATGYDVPSGFCVFGWTTESAEITLNITDRKTGVLVETQQLTVVYDGATESYQLTLNRVENFMDAQ